MKTGSVTVARDDGVGVATIDNAEHRNALSDSVLLELREALEALDADSEVRAIVVAGASDVFASGADIRSLLKRRPLDTYLGDRAAHWDAIRRVHTPVVAAVSGLCLGAGCELAMGCDVVIASRAARFGLPETALGLIPGAGGTQLLPRAIGKAKAMDMILTGRLLDAEEAEKAGLVSRVVDEDAWLRVAREVAATIAGRPAVAQRLAKEAVLEAAETALGVGITAERRAFALVFGTADAREGLTAFADRRRAIWTHG
jgi:enoyl-CoA hydratase